MYTFYITIITLLVDINWQSDVYKYITFLYVLWHSNLKKLNWENEM